MAQRLAAVSFVAFVLLALSQPALAAPPIFIGDDTPASCTEAALANALAVAAAVGGGTIKFRCGDGPVTIPVSATLVIPNNTSVNGGGTITLLGDGVIVALVAGDTTAALKGLVISGGCPFASCRGGVRNEGVLTIDNTTFSNNSVPNESALTNLGTVTVKNSAFLQNDGFLVAGGILNHGTLTVNNSTFVDNISLGGFGGAIANLGMATVHNSTFADGLVLGPGGGVVNVGTLAVKNCRFSTSHAEGQGGGGIASFSTLTVENSIFSPENHGESRGGGLYVASGFASVRNSVFSGNFASFGGGVYNSGTLELINSTISDNLASRTNFPFGGGFGGLGGGIFNAGALTVIHSSVLGNDADEEGGGIFNLGTLILNKSIVFGNTANVGGGIYNCPEGQIADGRPCHGTLTLQRTTVASNTPDDIFP